MVPLDSRNMRIAWDHGEREALASKIADALAPAMRHIEEADEAYRLDLARIALSVISSTSFQTLEQRSSRQCCGPAGVDPTDILEDHLDWGGSDS